jgi:uncharacterized transporter YbjL
MMTRSLIETLINQTAENASGTTGQTTRVSIFAIILVGLIAGLIVGLITSPTYTIQGFFLGFAGGALITTAAYFFTTEKGQPRR